MNRKELRKLIIESITEAKTKTQTDVDTAVQDMLDDLDLDDASLATTSSPDSSTADDDSPAVRGTGGSFDDILGQDLDSFLDDVLSGPAPEGNFEDEFSAAAARAQKNKARFQRASAVDDDLDPYDDIEDFVGTPMPKAPTTKKFQTSQPSYAGEPGLKQKSSGDPSGAIERVMMDEFVTPAMAVGQTVLPTVWNEIKRLAREPGFEDAFHIALNGIRTDEDIFFQNLLKLDLGAKQAPAPAESRELVERLRTVLSRYYNLVLDEAGKNSENLLGKLQAIRNKYTDEAFRTGFMKAIQKSRDLEDKAFGQFLGSTVGKKLSLRESLLYNVLNDNILMRRSRKV